MVDYARLSTTATRLLTKFGRQVTLVKFNETPVNPDKPWQGPASGGQTEVQLYGVFVPPSSIREFGLQGLGRGTDLGDLIAMSQQILIINPATNVVEQFTEVIDNGVRWGITATQVLQPGPTQVLAFIGLRR